MKHLFLIFIGLGVAGFATSLIVTNAGAKPLVANGQEDEAAAMMKAVREAARARAEKRENAEVPNAYCLHPNHNFGLMDPLTVGTHVFEIENRGAVPLILQGGQSSCKCTLSDLHEATVMPGEVYPVKLTWNSGHAKQEFQQSATVRTNDPTNREIQLTVSGHVKAVIAALPTQVNLDRLIPSQKTTKQFVLYSQVWDDIQIENVVSSNPHISAQVTDREFSDAFAFDDEIKNASCLSVIEITYDGEAPQGPLSGVLRLNIRPPQQWSSDHRTAADADASTVESESENSLPQIGYPMQDDGTILAEIPFYGSVVRRLSLYGKQVKSSGSIDLGTITPQTSAGSSWSIIGRIRGEQLPETVDVKLTGIPGLNATVEQLGEGRAKNSFRITFAIPEKMRPAIYNQGQAGKLVIEAPGMPEGDDLIEMPVNLIVIKKN